MEYLDEIINMRVKPSDKEKLIQKAKEKHLSISTYCRVKLLDEL
jgi:predicted HicB family RNase H-like nuclease